MSIQQARNIRRMQDQVEALTKSHNALIAAVEALSEKVKALEGRGRRGRPPKVRDVPAKNPDKSTLANVQ